MSLRSGETGALLGFRTPPDYENPADSDRDNEYELTVVAADQGGLEGTLEVAVTVTDQNEGPEVTGTTTFTHLGEPGELVGATYSGRDPEDPSLDITRWSVTGTDGGDFEINENGELSFRNSTGLREAGGLEQGQRVRGYGEGVGREVLRDAGSDGDGG